MIEDIENEIFNFPKSLINDILSPYIPWKKLLEYERVNGFVEWLTVTYQVKRQTARQWVKTAMQAFLNKVESIEQIIGHREQPKNSHADYFAF